LDTTQREGNDQNSPATSRNSPLLNTRQLNPVVTFALLLLRRLTLWDSFLLWLAQLIGGSLGALGVYLSISTSLLAGRKLARFVVLEGVTTWQELVVSLIHSFFFVLTVLLTLYNPRTLLATSHDKGSYDITDSPLGQLFESVISQSQGSQQQPPQQEGNKREIKDDIYERWLGPQGRVSSWQSIDDDSDNKEDRASLLAALSMFCC
jgi:hypothetical protein